MYKAGLSPEEICDLKVNDHIASTLNIRTDSPKRFPRPIRLDEEMIAILDKAIGNRRQRVDEPIFLNRQLRRLSVNTLRSYIKETAQKTGISKIAYRNFMSNLLVNAFLNGKDPIEVKAYLGYKNPHIIIEYRNTTAIL